MMPLINKQTQVRFKYVNKIPASAVQSFPQQKSQSPVKVQGIRANQQNKYAIQSFQSLRLQTKQSIPTAKNIKNSGKTSPIKNYNTQKYNFPQTSQSLLKSEQLEPVMETPSINTSIPTVQGELKQTKDDKFKIMDIPAMRQSQFYTEKKKKGEKVVKYSNNKTATSTDLVQNIIAQYSTPKNYDHMSYVQNRNSVLYRGEQSAMQQSRRGSRQIKTFKIQNIPEEKESNFMGCCGFGTSDKIAFQSR